ncbi:hypothetical protein ACP4OV_019374 [Aristida adscensionis]
MAPAPAEGEEDFLEVRCAGCGETLEVEPGLTEFICPDCSTAQALPPELMPPPPLPPLPRRRRSLPIPPAGPRNPAPVAAAAPTPARLPCGACGSLLSVPPGLARCGCPICGAELAVDAARLRQYLLSTAAATLVPVSLPPVFQAREVQQGYHDSAFRVGHTRGDLNNRPVHVERSQVRCQNTQPLPEYPDTDRDHSDTEMLNEINVTHSHRSGFSVDARTVGAKMRQVEPLNRVIYQAHARQSNYSVRAECPDRTVHGEEAQNESLNHAVHRSASHLELIKEKTVVRHSNRITGTPVGCKAVNVDKRQIHTLNQITGHVQKQPSKMNSDIGSSSDSDDPNDEQESAQTSSQTKQRKPRTASKWPTDKIVVTEINEDGTPTENNALRRMRRLAGLIARQRIPLTVERITEINKEDRESIFDKDVMSKLEFPPEMKKAASKKLWLMVASTRRNFRSKLAIRFVAKGLKPYDKYSFLGEADWQAFCQLKSTEEAIERSNKGKELRKKNKYDHHLGPAGYAGAIPKWNEEDAKMEAQGKENPWKVYPGRSRPFFRGRGKTDVESATITFYNKETESVSQKVVQKARESTEGSFSGVRENDILTAALGNPEHTGRVRGVSSYIGWGKWPDCKGMYRKRKKGHVDMQLIESMVEEKLAEERKKMRAEIHQEMMTLFASHRFTSIPP